jgi:hypothetical protein
MMDLLFPLVLYLSAKSVQPASWQADDSKTRQGLESLPESHYSLGAWQGGGTATGIIAVEWA